MEPENTVYNKVRLHTAPGKPIRAWIDGHEILNVIRAIPNFNADQTTVSLQFKAEIDSGAPSDG